MSQPHFESNGLAKKVCSFIPAPVMRHQSYSFAYLPNACKKERNWNLIKRILSRTYFAKVSALSTNSGDLIDCNSWKAKNLPFYVQKIKFLKSDIIFRRAVIPDI